MKINFKAAREMSEHQYCIVGRPETDLVGHMECLSENPNGVELDDVVLNRNIEEILKNDAWADEAV